MPGNRTIRSTLIALLVLGLTSILGTPVSADTTTTTGASVTVTDAGTLDVHWSGDDVTFLTDGQAPAVTAVEGTTASATFTLVVADTRADGNRPGYEIRITADPFTISGTGQVLPASQLAIADIAGLPEGVDASDSIGGTLDGGVTVLSVPPGFAAIDTMLDITITMTIPAGTYPGTFNGSVTVEVLPVT